MCCEVNHYIPEEQNIHSFFVVGSCTLESEVKNYRESIYGTVYSRARHSVTTNTPEKDK